jgi:hypothetical protein
MPEVLLQAGEEARRQASLLLLDCELTNSLSHGAKKINQPLAPHTDLLTPWSRILLEKLTGLQLVKKFPTFYGTRRFITAVTSARHLSLS